MNFHVYCLGLANRWAKGQFISKGLFDFFNSSKTRTKNFCSSSLEQKLKFSVHFLEEFKKPKFPFKINWPLRSLLTHKKTTQMFVQLQVGLGLFSEPAS